MTLSQDICQPSCKGCYVSVFIFMILLTAALASAVEKQDIRISLLGITGSGKSTTGNLLLNKTDSFKISGSSHSETFECSDDDIQRDGRTVKIIDTPGFMDTRITFKELQTRIIPFIGRSAPGPHALLYVLEAGRFTDEQQSAIEMYTNILGEDVYNYTVIVFTKLADSISELDFVDNPHKNLKMFLEKCDRRFVFLPSLDKTAEMKVKIDHLYGIIDKMIVANNGAYYTDQMFKAQEKILKEKLEEQRQRQIKEEEEKLNAIKSKVAAEYEETVNRLEDDLHMSNEKQSQLEDYVKILLDKQNEYDKKIENLNKEITLDKQRIADLSRGPTYRCLGPLCIRFH